MMILRTNVKLISIAGLAAIAAACSTTPGKPETTVSVQFDPDALDQRDMIKSATSMCKAKGYQTAAPYTVQPTMSRGSWDYMTYGCY